MAYRFNPPPHWPPPPPGWVPPPGWLPPPGWPAPPPGWPLWVDDTAGTPPPLSAPPGAGVPAAAAGQRTGRHAKAGPPDGTVSADPPPAPAHAAGPAVAVPPAAAVPPPVTVTPPAAAEAPAASARQDKVGRLGAQQRAEALLAENSGLAGENERLRQQMSALLGMDTDQLTAEANRRRAEIQASAEQARTELAAAQRNLAEARRARDGVLAEASAAAQQLRDLRAQIVVTDEIAALQEAGVYEYRHPLQDAVAYKSRLADIKDTVKAMTSQRTAVKSATSWTVNGSVQKGTAMVREVSKLMLRAYNAEADNCVRTLRPHTLQASITRLGKARDTIARLGQTMSIQISEAYHRQRVLELELTADYLVKQEEEKDRVRAERERQKEEEAARRDFERERTRLLKEQAHYSTALARLQAKGDTSGAADMQAHLDQVAESIKAVERREANVRAGYVYVISNIGSFGENMIKVGMTRRLDPMDRIRELSDASVPFRFDVHAFIFSEDAVNLETQLHHGLEHCRVNQVNRRREFFRATPAGVLALLEEVAGQHLIEFTEIPEALEWRASTAALSQAG